MSKYKDTVATLRLVDVFPHFHQDSYADVRALDEERLRLAQAYEAADGALLAKIRMRLTQKGRGEWGEYLRARGLPGSSAHERMKVAQNQPVSIARWSSSAAYKWTHPCEVCGSVDSVDSCAPLYGQWENDWEGRKTLCRACQDEYHGTPFL